MTLKTSTVSNTPSYHGVKVKVEYLRMIAGEIILRF